jgi:diaminopimelate decarboxylase
MTTSFSEHIGYDDDGDLAVDGAKCASLLQRFGSPLFVVSQAQIVSNVSRFQRALRAGYPRSQILFATKANNNLAVRCVFTGAGAGGDAFGAGELQITLAAGTPPEAIVLNGFNKQDPEVRLAIASGVPVNLDAPDELDQVVRLAREMGRVARVGVRSRLLLYELDEVLGDWPAAGFDSSISTVGRNMRERDKFGVSPADFLPLCRAAHNEPAVELVGVHYHMGRELGDANLWTTLIRDQCELVGTVRDAIGWSPSYFDFGGGMTFGRPEGHGPLGVDRGKPTYEEYAEVITSTFRSCMGEYDLGEPVLMIEPGRALSSNIAILVGTVQRRKEVPETGQTWLGVDICQNQMINILSGGFYYHPVPLAKRSGSPAEVVNIADPQCWYGNLAFACEIDRLEVGDQIAFLDTGAYCESMSTQFNALPRPATVLVDGGDAELITERETFDDVLRLARVPARLMNSRVASQVEAKWIPAGEGSYRASSDTAQSGFRAGVGASPMDGPVGGKG